jgi:hypothetical protein
LDSKPVAIQDGLTLEMPQTLSPALQVVKPRIPPMP